MIIERRLKYIKFVWDDGDQTLTIVALGKIGEKSLVDAKDGMTDQPVTGWIQLNKTYLFSTMRFMIRCMQRMTRGFPAWVKKRSLTKKT